MGRPLAFPTSIGQGWEGLPWTKTLAYYEKFVNYGRKKLYNIGPRAHEESLKAQAKKMNVESLRSNQVWRHDIQLNDMRQNDETSPCVFVYV